MFEGENLRLAVRRVKQNGGAPGVDSVTVAELPAHLREHWDTVRNQLQDKVRELTCRSKSMSMDKRIGKLNRYLMGWLGYFRIAYAKRHCENFDQWIRRRLRMCRWKQWKKPAHE